MNDMTTTETTTTEIAKTEVESVDYTSAEAYAPKKYRKQTEELRYLEDQVLMQKQIDGLRLMVSILQQTVAERDQTIEDLENLQRRRSRRLGMSADALRDFNP